MKLFAVRAGSGLARVGLCNGDVVTRLNGLALTSPDAALSLPKKPGNAVVIELHRASAQGRITVHLR